MSDKTIRNELCFYFNESSVNSDFGCDSPTEIGDCDTGLFIIENSCVEQLSNEEFKLLDDDSRNSELCMSVESCDITEKETGVSVRLEKSISLQFDDSGLPSGQGDIASFDITKINLRGRA